MDKKYLEKMRHSCEHVLQQAMVKLYPGLKMAMGPPIENGFYFDFEYSGKISEEDFPKIEAEMKKIIKRNLPIKKEKISLKKAREMFNNNPYKQEWLDEIEKKGEEATVYWTGNEFVDLCAGPHLSSTGQIGAFKLISIAGAYWRGNEKNKMLTRIYGVCFPTQKELDQYLWQLEEAKKRDHRKLGKELNLFIIPNEVGSGLVIWLPDGAIIRRQIENLIISEQSKRGYLHVYSPHIGNKTLWETSGHWELYREKMYSPMKIDEDEYLVKPMNCPMHMMVYKSQIRSYRDLPLRIAEVATVYRYEQPGELSGLLRVRHITQDDAHIFCRPDQVVDEFLQVFDLINHLLKIFNISNYQLRLGLRSKKEKYLGNDQLWQKAEKEIIRALKKRGLNYLISEGDAAFYGPKLDIIINDSLNRKWQCGTIQVDFMLPERFQLEYTDSDGVKKRPVLIHRAPLGSLERWVAILIEHYSGNFPLWLSPTQVAILPVSDRHLDYAEQLALVFKKNEIRYSINKDTKTLGAKIRETTLKKIPYMIIIGDKELESYQVDRVYKVSVRTRDGKDYGLLELYEFITRLKSEIEKRQ